jgi:hypothetical protein
MLSRTERGRFSHKQCRSGGFHLLFTYFLGVLHLLSEYVTVVLTFKNGTKLDFLIALYVQLCNLYGIVK